MGLNRSREMSSSNVQDDESASGNSDNESDLATILQYLIRSGQVRILGSDDNMPSFPKPPPSVGSNVENMKNSEIVHMTKLASGISYNDSITEMLKKREIGLLKRGCGFNEREKCYISNNKLPVKLRPVDTYDHKVFCGVYSQDGNRLLTASQDRLMRLYDSSNGVVFKQLLEIHGRDVGWSILDAAFSPDSRHIAYSSWSPTLHMVDIEGGGDACSHKALELCPDERRFCVFSLAFSESGHDIVCGANDGNIYIYNLAANDRTLKVEAHDDDVNTVTFADNTSQIVYSGGDDGLCKVWDRRTLSELNPKPVGVLAGHMDGVTYIDSRGDARHLISNSKDQSIKLWDIRVFSSSSAQEAARKAVSLSRWDYRWQTAPKKLLTRRANMKGDTSLATYRGHSVLQTLIRCHFSPAFTTGQRFIYTGCAYGRVIVYDLLTGAIILTLQGHTSCVRDVSWHPYRPELISSSWDFSVICWNHFGLVQEDSEVGSNMVLDEEFSRPLRRSQRIADRNRTH
uniref:Putative ddb1-and cul4-associated factor 11ddb1-and cul4-associated factor 11 n=1 Tax=Triatoma dimidiata TaxID=72491 RepID=A0A0V0G5M9_TRIDM